MDNNHLIRTPQRTGGMLVYVYAFLQLMNPLCYITDSLRMEGIFSFISRLYILVSAGAFMVYALQVRIATERIIYLVLMALTALLSCVLFPGSMSTYEAVILLAGYLALPIYIIIIPEIRFSKPLYRWTFLCNLASSLFFIYAGFFRPEYSKEAGALTMGYFNANQAAIFLVQNLSVMLCCFRYEKNPALRILILAICLLDAFFIYQTLCRTALMCILILAYVHVKKSKMIPMKYLRIGFVFPIVIVAAMMLLSNNRLLAEIELMGKPLMTGRDEVYYYSFIKMRGHWILGNFGAFGFTNLHNAYLSVLATCGVVGMIPFLAFYWNSVKQLWLKHTNSEIAAAAFAAILLIFVEGSAEAAMLVSGSMYAGAYTALLFFLNCEEDAA